MRFSPAPRRRPWRLVHCPVVPVPSAGDALRLQQIVANLSVERDQVHARGRAGRGRLTSTGSHAEIQVADTGQGIDRGVSSAPLRAIHSGRPLDHAAAGRARPRARHRQGARRAARGDCSGGQPGRGHGATFTVRLPVLPPQKQRRPSGCGRRGTRRARARAARRYPGRPGRGRRRRAAGPHADPRVAGAKVTAAASVREALAALDTFRPDVIVSDIGMPGRGRLCAHPPGPSPRSGRRRRTHSRHRAHGYVPPETGRLLAAGFQTHSESPLSPTRS